MHKTGLRRRSAQGWQEVFERYEASGLNATAFCEREGIERSGFYRWCRKLGRALPPGDCAVVADSPAGFVDLGALRGSGNARLELRLDLGGGVILHLIRS